MKLSSLLIALVLLAATIMPASEQTWTGKISDSACAAHHEQGEGVEKMTDADCTAACIRGGSRYVFISDEKVYVITNQDQADLAKLAGIAVKVTGELKGDAITVSKVEKAPELR